jgi:hypothetical protein
MSYSRKTLGFVAFAGRQRFHHRLHFLCPILLHHQHGVLGRDDHQVVDAHDTDQRCARFAHHHAAGNGAKDYIARNHVASFVFVADVRKRGPTAHVVPAEIAGNHANACGLFHDAIVDGNPGRRRVTLFRAGEKIAACADFIENRGQVGHVRLGFAEQAARCKKEHARVPEEIASGEIPCGIGGVGLFHESRHLVNAVAHRSAALEIAVAGLGTRGLDTNRDDRFGGVFQRRGHHATKLGLIRDEGVRRKDRQTRIVACSTRHCDGAKSHRRPGVARRRLDDQVVGGKIG